MKLGVSVALLLASIISVFAHMDPTGDLWPLVKVENGNFAVYFYNNSREDWAYNYPVFRMIYSSTGELLGPRVRCKDIQSNDILGAPASVYEKGIELRNERIIFDSDLRNGKKPSYFITNNGVRKHWTLPWPDNVRLDYVAGVAATEKSIAVLATIGRGILTLFCFDREKREQPTSAVIGEPASIYSFPTVSNLVFAFERYWLAWIRYNRDREKFETVLSDWKPGDEKPHETVLDAPSDWNVHLSMAASGDRLCVAYHCSITGEYPGYSRIVTVFYKLK